MPEVQVLYYGGGIWREVSHPVDSSPEWGCKLWGSRKFRIDCSFPISHLKVGYQRCNEKYETKPTLIFSSKKILLEAHYYSCLVDLICFIKAIIFIRKIYCCCFQSILPNLFGVNLSLLSEYS